MKESAAPRARIFHPPCRVRSGMPPCLARSALPRLSIWPQILSEARKPSQPEMTPQENQAARRRPGGFDDQARSYFGQEAQTVHIPA